MSPFALSSPSPLPAGTPLSNRNPMSALGSASHSRSPTSVTTTRNTALLRPPNRKTVGVVSHAAVTGTLSTGPLTTGDEPEHAPDWGRQQVRSAVVSGGEPMRHRRLFPKSSRLAFARCQTCCIRFRRQVGKGVTDTPEWATRSE